MRILATMILLSGLLVCGQVHAHAHLRAAAPEASATGPSPPQLSLAFSEALEPKLSRITVTAGGVTVAEGVSLVPADDPRRMVLPLPKLAPATYVVNWVAVSIDTHRTEGSYSFTIAP